MHIQSDLKFIPPPPSAIGLHELGTKEYRPKEGQLAIVSEKGAKPHFVQGENFVVQVGKKPAGRHLIVQITCADPILVKHGKDELVLDAGVYYVSRTDGKVDAPLVQ